MKITEDLLTKNIYSRPGNIRNITKAIVLHWTGNPAASAKNNRDYFNNLKNQIVQNGFLTDHKTRPTYASSNYIIGKEGEIILCVPENEVAYTSGWYVMSDLVKGWGIDVNYATIGIEVCPIDIDGNFSKETFLSMEWLCEMLLKKYQLQITDLIRHFDCCGGPDASRKDCPRLFVRYPSQWIAFKSKISDKMK